MSPPLSTKTPESSLPLAKRAVLPKCPSIQTTIYLPGDIPQTLSNQAVNGATDINDTAVFMSKSNNY